VSTTWRRICQSPDFDSGIPEYTPNRSCDQILANVYESDVWGNTLAKTKTSTITSYAAAATRNWMAIGLVENDKIRRDDRIEEKRTGEHQMENNRVGKYQGLDQTRHPLSEVISVHNVKSMYGKM